MISHGLEISIAGGIVEMVRGPMLRRFLFLFCFFFLYHVLCIFNYGEQRLRAALAMAKKKPDVPWMYPPRPHGKSHQPKSLWSGTNRTPAT